MLEPLVIQGLSHSVNLGMTFLQEYNLQMICTEEEVAFMPIQDRLCQMVRLVERGCHNFINKKSRAVLRISKDQMI